MPKKAVSPSTRDPPSPLKPVEKAPSKAAPAAAKYVAVPDTKRVSVKAIEPNGKDPTTKSGANKEAATTSNTADTKPDIASLTATPETNDGVEDTLEVPLGIFGPQFSRRETEDLCFAMGMTIAEVNRLIAIFNDIDVNCSYVGPHVEFYHLLETPQNAYTLGVLRLAPARKDPRKLEIDDFVEIVCKFVRMRPKEVITFCFETFDEDESGALDPLEFLNMCNAIQVKGEGFFNGNFKKAMESFDKNNDGLLDLDEFQQINAQFPLVFYPLFQFQNKMLYNTLGWWKWYQITHREIKIAAWRHYMNTHLGREPPMTLEDQLLSCVYKTNQLRLIAAQLYKMDQARLVLQAKRAAMPPAPKPAAIAQAVTDKYKQRSPSKKAPIQPPNPPRSSAVLRGSGVNGRGVHAISRSQTATKYMEISVHGKTTATSEKGAPAVDTQLSEVAVQPHGASAADIIEAPVGLYERLVRRTTEDLCYAKGMTVRDVQKLLAIFDDIDVNYSGRINLVEFYHLLNSPENQYTRGILRLAPQRQEPKKLTIDDFVEILVKFACMSRADVVHFCFETFDEDESGALDNLEFLNMCSSIQVKHDTFFGGNFRRAMAFFDKNHDGLLDLREFQGIRAQYELIFYPLFRFQNKVRSRTLGRFKWHQIELRARKVEEWRSYMHTHLGREPPTTWVDHLGSWFSMNRELRLVAAQLFKADQARILAKTKQNEAHLTQPTTVTPGASDVYDQRRKKTVIQPPNLVAGPNSPAKAQPSMVQPGG
ncbi:hypothetical protein ACHHYP_09457 [Achlya hypogyna]|uniref:EF-hand domain-containing protein n=1 Tax=Achlya hypogyna TaxID=1202772 RepID=A0A1V9ZJD8_ACHHY|nr:hypothetical protein ACHHYP_09457 [Achlya hypogyna]